MNKSNLVVFIVALFTLQTAQAEIFGGYGDSGPVYAPQSTYKSKSTKRSTKRKTVAAKKTKSSRKSQGGGGNIASCYWQPQKLASGGRFNPRAMSAAHKTLPFGTKLEVTNLRNGRTVQVVINDRGPYVKGRVLDLSDSACKAFGVNRSIAPVSFKIIGKASKAEMAALTLGKSTRMASTR